MANPLMRSSTWILIVLPLGLLVFSIVFGLLFLIIPDRVETVLEDLEVEDLQPIELSDEANAAYSVDDLGCEKTAYVPVLATVFHGPRTKLLGLAGTLSVRNVSESDSFGLTRVDYFDTDGDKLKSIVSKPLRMGPLQTREYFIEVDENEGGSGANFIVSWRANDAMPDPIIETVMIGGYGTKGVSVTSRAVITKDNCAQ